MDPSKLNGIREWLIPKSVKQVCSWLVFEGPVTRLEKD